jgi:hypothetical protein
MIKKYNDDWEFDTETNSFQTWDKYGDLYTLTPQALADMISFIHAEKVKKDNEIKAKFSESNG